MRAGTRSASTPTRPGLPAILPPNMPATSTSFFQSLPGSACRCRSAGPQIISRARRCGGGGWDPYNVTEDADLGMRLARLG